MLAMLASPGESRQDSVSRELSINYYRSMV